MVYNATMIFVETKLFTSRILEAMSDDEYLVRSFLVREASERSDGRDQEGASEAVRASSTTGTAEIAS